MNKELINGKADTQFLNWSGGKDSAYCLYRLHQLGIPVRTVVTNMHAASNRITMHGVERSLLEAQVRALNLDLHIIELPDPPGMVAYEASVAASNRKMRSLGFNTAVFGDIFLEDLKQYREQLYAKDGIACSFPLWKMNTRQLAEAFISAGFKAVVVAVNGSMIDASFCGRLLDHSFLEDLPESADPCGENGEYHSFVFDGPFFRRPVGFTKGAIVERMYPSPVADDCHTEPAPAVPFYFCNLQPD